MIRLQELISSTEKKQLQEVVNKRQLILDFISELNVGLKRLIRCPDCVKRFECKLYPYWDKVHNEPKLCQEKIIILK